jgi:hypothetical protein
LIFPFLTGDGVFEVKSTNGDTHLGGDDFDHMVIDGSRIPKMKWTEKDRWRLALKGSAS